MGHRPQLYQVAAEAANRLGLSDPARWYIVMACATGRAPHFRLDVREVVDAELAGAGLLHPETGQLLVRRLLATAGLAWEPKGSHD